MLSKTTDKFSAYQMTLTWLCQLKQKQSLPKFHDFRKEMFKYSACESNRPPHPPDCSTLGSAIVAIAHCTTHIAHCLTGESSTPVLHPPNYSHSAIAASKGFFGVYIPQWQLPFERNQNTCMCLASLLGYFN
jgi:hypothetical protein